MHAPRLLLTALALAAMAAPAAAEDSPFALLPGISPEWGETAAADGSSTLDGPAPQGIFSINTTPPPSWLSQFGTLSAEQVWGAAVGLDRNLYVAGFGDGALGSSGGDLAGFPPAGIVLGSFDIVVAPRARPGNWLPTGGIDRYVLVLRLYDTPVGVATRAGRETTMPLMSRRVCP